MISSQVTWFWGKFETCYVDNNKLIVVYGTLNDSLANSFKSDLNVTSGLLDQCSNTKPNCRSLGCRYTYSLLDYSLHTTNIFVTMTLDFISTTSKCFACIPRLYLILHFASVITSFCLKCIITKTCK